MIAFSEKVLSLRAIIIFPKMVRTQRQKVENKDLKRNITA